MSNNYGQNTNSQGAANAASGANYNDEIEERLQRQLKDGKTCMEQAIKAFSNKQTQSVMKEYEAHFKYWAAKREEERKKSNGTQDIPVVKNNETLEMLKPIQHANKGNEIVENPISVQSKSENVICDQNLVQPEDKGNVSTEITPTPVEPEDNTVKITSTVPLQSSDVIQDVDAFELEEKLEELHQQKQPQQTSDSIPNASKYEDKDEKEEVGYGKPHKKYQFKKGQSGNPKGRPKKFIPKTTMEWLKYIASLNLSEINKMAQTDMTGDQAYALSIYQKALKGDRTAMKILSEAIGDVDVKEFIRLKLRDEEKRTAAERESAELTHCLLIQYRESIYGAPLDRKMFEAPMTEIEEVKLKDYLYERYLKNTERKAREEHHLENEDHNFDETIQN